jgi:hypothetical protein
MASFSILADENVERQAARYLERQGHDVELVVDIDDLGPGSNDESIHEHALRTDRLVLTSDDDFFAFEEPFLFLPNDRLDAYKTAIIVDTIGEHVTRESLSRPVYVTDAWLN